jgi:hypothetical protein
MDGWMLFRVHTGYLRRTVLRYVREDDVNNKTKRTTVRGVIQSIKKTKTGSPDDQTRREGEGQNTIDYHRASPQ